MRFCRSITGTGGGGGGGDSLRADLDGSSPPNGCHTAEEERTLLSRGVLQVLVVMMAKMIMEDRDKTEQKIDKSSRAVAEMLRSGEQAVTETGADQ